MPRKMIKDSVGWTEEPETEIKQYLDFLKNYCKETGMTQEETQRACFPAESLLEKVTEVRRTKV